MTGEYRDWTDENLIAVTPERFLKTVGQAFLRSLRQPMRMLAALIGMALLSLLLSGIQDIQNSPSVQPLFGAVSVLCIAAVLSSPVLGCLHTVSDLVGDVSVFLAAYIPIMAGVLLAAGRTASATAYNTLMFLGCEGAALIIRSAVIPAAGILLALGVTGAVAGNEHLLRLGKTMRRTVSWTLGLVLILFIGLMTLQTSVAAASDTVASKSAKYLLGSLIPVVGSSVSEAVMAARGCLRSDPCQCRCAGDPGSCSHLSPSAASDPGLVLCVLRWLVSVRTSGRPCAGDPDG